jgi:hypothetical protein
MKDRNAKKLDQFFTDKLNSVYYRVEFTNYRSGPVLTFKRGSNTDDLVRGSWPEKLGFDWPSPE